MKKALIFIGSFLLLILTVIFVFFFCEHQKNLSGLYSKPSCSPWTPPLYFETKNSYIAWIENPNLGIDEMTDQCECPDANHTIPPGEPIPRSYKYSVRSDEHRMFVVDRMYPLVHFPKNFSSTGQYHEYGMLTHGGMACHGRERGSRRRRLV